MAFTPAAASRHPALAAWALAAAGFLAAALCLASLSFDGSYYLLQTLQEGAPTVPHHRWLNKLILAPVLWAKPFVNGPVPLAMLHGLLCAVVPLASLAACLAMLRGRAAPLRMWAVFGILLAPLPGQVVLVGEVTPAIQAGWVGLAFVWCGCPWRWAPAALLAGAAMWGLHPVAVPLFGFACLTALALGVVSRTAPRRRFLAWSAFFGLATLAKACDAACHATVYERANLHGNAWLGECFTGLLMTPFAALLPAFAAAVLDFSGKPPSARLQRWLWGAALGLGLGYGLFPGGWVGAICYRKFGIVMATPLVLMAGVEACRLWRNQPLAGRGSGAFLRPALLFAVTLAAMSLSWKGLCLALANQLAACPGPVQTHEALPRLERNSALNHWSTTSLSLVLQGWKPGKVHVWDARAQRAQGKFSICPENEFAWRDGAFSLAWIGRFPLCPATGGGSSAGR